MQIQGLRKDQWWSDQWVSYSPPKKSLYKYNHWSIFPMVELWSNIIFTTIFPIYSPMVFIHWSDQLGGSNSRFFNFHSYFWGRWTQFDKYFFKGVGSTTNQEIYKHLHLANLGNCPLYPMPSAPSKLMGVFKSDLPIGIRSQTLPSFTGHPKTPRLVPEGDDRLVPQRLLSSEVDAEEGGCLWWCRGVAVVVGWLVGWWRYGEDDRIRMMNDENSWRS